MLSHLNLIHNPISFEPTLEHFPRIYAQIVQIGGSVQRLVNLLVSFYNEGLMAQALSRRTTPCQLSVTVYPVYS
jgi:hypothetical protein